MVMPAIAPGPMLEDIRIDTPAYIYDEAKLVDTAVRVSQIVRDAGCSLLYSLKAFAGVSSLELLRPVIAGFATSSVFEATLARSVLGKRGTVHITSPGLRLEEMPQVVGLCDFITFNSLTQWTNLQPLAGSHSRCGIRVNPQLSFLNDNRYDPCRIDSKLGVGLEDLGRAFSSSKALVSQCKGLHFHSNCDSTDFTQLYVTVKRIHSILGSELLDKLEWVNIGGGYVFSVDQDTELFHKAVQLIGRNYGLQTFVEPGAALTREAGILIASVVDLFSSNGQSIAVLDTTVNHLPEVFEYQYEPDVLGDSEEGNYEYFLVGSSCLAGDVFGQYAFGERLVIGSRIVFPNVGAYSLVKAHMFNGINLPTVYTRSACGDLAVQKRFSYDDFASHCGVVSQC